MRITISSRRMLVKGLRGGANTIPSLIPQSIRSRRLCPSVQYHRVESDDLRRRDVITDEGRGKYVGAGEDGVDDAWSVFC